MRILELRLASDLVHELRRFYVERLGFFEEEQVGGTDGLRLEIGHTHLTFVPGTADRRYHFAFNIPYGCLEDAAAWLVKCGVQLVEQPGGKGPLVDFPNWNAQSVYFFDPSGNIVELIARKDLPHARGKAFTPALISGVSEIGVPFDEPEMMRDFLTTAYGLPVFAKQKPGPNFSALGDDEGLLLLVPTGRSWFMGDFAAGKFPTAVKLEQGGKTTELIWYS